MLGVQRILQRANRKITGDVAVGYAGDHAPVIEVYDRAVAANRPVLQEQTGEIRTPLLVQSVCAELLFQPVFKLFVESPRLRSRLFLRTMERSPSSRFIYLWMVALL